MHKQQCPLSAHPPFDIAIGACGCALSGKTRLLRFTFAARKCGCTLMKRVSAAPDIFIPRMQPFNFFLLLVLGYMRAPHVFCSGTSSIVTRWSETLVTRSNGEPARVEALADLTQASRKNQRQGCIQSFFPPSKWHARPCRTGLLSLRRRSRRGAFGLKHGGLS